MISYVFQRYEQKYLLTPEQYEIMKKEADKTLHPDEFGETTIQSLYYDTPNFQLFRASLEGPVFKEKLRVRCYGINNNDRNVYIEMKRKCDEVVYKRRIACKENDALNLFKGNFPSDQIGRELEYFTNLYEDIGPQIMILTERAAYFDTGHDFRLTFDKNMRYRTTDLNFHSSPDGIPLVDDGYVLMELKSGEAIPLRFCRLMSDLGIKKQSFSKIGAAYIAEFKKQQISRSFQYV